MIDARTEITGLVLAGGESRRMGGTDKGLVVLAGQPMIRHVLSRLAPQVQSVLINANRNLDRYQAEGYPVVADSVGDFLGPLAGMVSGLQTASTEYLLSVPCDSPLLPHDLAQRMTNTLEEEDADLVTVTDGTRMHPVFLLVHRSAASGILTFLHSGERKIDKWFAGQKLAIADFSDQAGAFVNVNRPEERMHLEQQLHAGTA